jgi:MFS superfamily sulfate permease-like transporter
MGVLGEMPGHRGLLVVASPEEVETTPGVVVFRFGAQLFFANAETFRQEVVHLVESTRPEPHWFVLDAEVISDIDTTGADTLRRVLSCLEARGLTFAISRLSPSVRSLLVRYELLDEIGDEHLFETNRDALEAFQRLTVQTVPSVSDATAE